MFHDDPNTLINYSYLMKCMKLETMLDHYKNYSKKFKDTKLNFIYILKQMGFSLEEKKIKDFQKYFVQYEHVKLIMESYKSILDSLVIDMDKIVKELINYSIIGRLHVVELLNTLQQELDAIQKKLNTYCETNESKLNLEPNNEFEKKVI